MDKRFLFLSVSYIILIFYLSSKSALPVPYVFDFQDLILHFIEYFVLYCLLGKAFCFNHKFGIAVFAILYGASDEIHQYFVPGRVMSLSDFLADSLGILVAYFLLFKFQNFFLVKLYKRI